MRLFIAILFDDGIKNILYRTVDQLKECSKGSYTAKENLHLTVNFIGETDRFSDIKQIMERSVEETTAKEFQISIRGLGKFKRREGDIYWIGVEKEDTLWKLQKELANKLKESGFPDIEMKEYQPHLTMGRKIHVNPGFEFREFEAGIEPLWMTVNKISLMKSERLQGKLVYTEIFNVKLE